MLHYVVENLERADISDILGNYSIMSVFPAIILSPHRPCVGGEDRDMAILVGVTYHASTFDVPC